MSAIEKRTAARVPDNPATREPVRRAGIATPVIATPKRLVKSVRVERRLKWSATRGSVPMVAEAEIIRAATAHLPNRRLIRRAALSLLNSSTLLCPFFCRPCTTRVRRGAISMMPATAEKLSWNEISKMANGSIRSIRSAASESTLKYSLPRPAAKASTYAPSMITARVVETGKPATRA